MPYISQSIFVNLKQPKEISEPISRIAYEDNKNYYSYSYIHNTCFLYHDIYRQSFWNITVSIFYKYKFDNLIIKFCNTQFTITNIKIIYISINTDD